MTLTCAGSCWVAKQRLEAMGCEEAIAPKELGESASICASTLEAVVDSDRAFASTARYWEAPHGWMLRT